MNNIDRMIAATVGALDLPHRGPVLTALRDIGIRLQHKDIQCQVRCTFAINVHDPSGNMKTYDAIIGEMAARYRKLTREDQSRFLDIAGGSTLALVLATILKNYPSENKQS